MKHNKRIQLPIKEIESIDEMPLLAIRSTIGTQKGYLIIDTGAQVSAVGNHVDLPHTELRQLEQVSGITNDILDVALLEVGEVKMGRHKIPLGICFKIDLSHIQSKIKSRYHILGLIGLTFLIEYEAIIDFRQQVLILNATKSKNKSLTK